MKFMGIFLLFVLLSCNKQEDTQRSKLKILNQLSGPLTHIDPHLRTDLATGVQLGKVYESLYETHPYDNPFVLIPNLAADMPEASNDGMTYTIKIRPNIYYQENKCFKGKRRQLIAEDFITSFKRIGDPHLVSPHYGYWKKHIRGLEEWYEKNKSLDKTDYSQKLPGVEALDDLTLKIDIIGPNMDFKYTLTTVTSAPIPREIIDCYDNDLTKGTVGTGPFVLKSFVRKSRMEFERNPNFRYKEFPRTGAEKYKNVIAEYGGKKVPFLDKITVHIMSESQAAWLNFLKGKVDYLEIPKDNMSEAFTNNNELTPEMIAKGIDAGQSPSSTNIFYFGLNMKHPALKKKKVRQAIAHAFDEERYLELFWKNMADMANSILPPNIPGNTPPLLNPYMGANIEKARALLKSAGHENGKGIPELTILVKNKTVSRQIAEFLGSEMKKIGIKSRVDAVTWSNMLQKAQGGKFDIFFLAWFTGIPSAFEFFELAYGPNHPDSFNRVGYQNAKFDKSFITARTSMDKSLREKLIKEMNQALLDDVPLIPLMHSKNYFLSQKWLKNYVPAEQYVGIELYYDIDKELKKKYLKMR